MGVATRQIRFDCFLRRSKSKQPQDCFECKLSRTRTATTLTKYFSTVMLLSRHYRTPTPQVRVIGRCMINFNCGAAYMQADFATTIQESALNTHHVRAVARMARTQSSDESGWATKYLLRDVIRQQNGRRGSSKSIGYSEKCTIRW